MKNMLPHSSAAAAFLGVILALASFDNACAHESRGLRGLMNDDEGSHAACGVPALTQTEVRAFNSMVDKFYQDAQSSPDGNRRLQQTITVDVNFVNVKSTAGLGATEADVRAQMDVLNEVFRPDFVFNYNSSQDVIDDNYFGGIDSSTFGGPVELQMKTEYRQGGLETLNIYSTNIMTNGRRTSGWATFDPNDIPRDGVVMEYATVPNGGDSKGFVSIDRTSLAPLTSCMPCIRC
jgi:hypothetical protein